MGVGGARSDNFVCAFVCFVLELLCFVSPIRSYDSCVHLAAVCDLMFA